MKLFKYTPPSLDYVAAALLAAEAARSGTAAQRLRRRQLLGEGAGMLSSELLPEGISFEVRMCGCGSVAGGRRAGAGLGWAHVHT
eukprot:365833-Chlamydomonas_euryale.AAC.2